MNQQQKRVFLIEYLKSEMVQYRDIKIPSNENEQKNLLRALMNIRSPMPISQEFLKLQDEYLSTEIEQRGIIDVDSLSVSFSNNHIFLWKGDISRLKVDAIVNAANSALLGCFQPCHNCIDNVIHSFAGIQLRLTCNEIMQKQGYDEPVGKAKITDAFNLPCRYILHTVGPTVSNLVTQSDCDALSDCYKSCLKLASQNGLRSIAFCCISTGVFHFPQTKAAEIAIKTVKQFLSDNSSIQKVVFDVFTEADYNIYSNLLNI